MEIEIKAFQSTMSALEQGLMRNPLLNHNMNYDTTIHFQNKNVRTPQNHLKH